MKRLLISFPVFLLLAGCGAFSFSSKASESEHFSVMLWNVQAFFDGNEDGSEYAEYSEASGWTPEKYRARVTTISQAIQQIMPSGNTSTAVTSAAAPAVPGLIGFVEIENAGILEDLAAGALSKYGYNWTAFANLEGSPLGLGVLSRYPIKEARSHSITVGEATAPRPVLEVRIEPRDKPLIFLLCHWKSKLGKETESLRQASAKVVQRRLRELGEAETPVVIMGDLNENHDEFFLRGGTELSALLPDDPGAAALAKKAQRLSAGPNVPWGFLVLSGERPPRSLAMENVPAVYSPWMEDTGGGSYFFRGEWETIDHFLLSDILFDGAGWDFSGFQVLDSEPFIGSGGEPNAYIPRNGRGLSDHLPLMLYLKDFQ